MCRLISSAPAAAGCASGDAAKVAPDHDAAGPAGDGAGELAGNDASGATSGDGSSLPSDWGDAGQVAGTVVDFNTTRPLAGRSVFIGAQRVVTDANGQFSLNGIAPTYDAIVADPDLATISMYRGLNRRDPVLPHLDVAAGAKRALAKGDLSGGGNYPLSGSDFVSVAFFSPQADSMVLLNAQRGGPGYGPMPLAWNGADSISGQLVALGTFYGAGGGGITDAGYSVWFATQPLTLANGQSASANLALAPVTDAGHIAGFIQAPPGSRIDQKEIFYRFPVVHASLVVPAPGGSPAFDDVVPDLTGSGAELCVGAAATPGSSLTRQCGIALGRTDVTVTLESPPTLSAPLDGDTITKDTTFTWSTFDNGIQLLELQPTGASASAPQVFLFTSGTSSAWPDLSSAGVAFPAGAGYQCSIEGLGPYPSVDDALGPNGIGASHPAELRRSLSLPIQVTTSP